MINTYGHSIVVLLSGLLLSHSCAAEEAPVEPLRNPEFWLWLSQYGDTDDTVFDPIDLDSIEQASTTIEAGTGTKPSANEHPPINATTPTINREATQ